MGPVRVSFLALALLASAASAAGLTGIWSHDPGGVAEALGKLPAPWGTGAVGSLPADEPMAARALTGGATPAQADGNTEVRPVDAFLAHRFSESVQQEIEAACPPKVRRATDICMTSIRARLVEVGQQIQREQRRFQQVLEWSRLLWGAAGFFALLMIIRAYEHVRRQERRLSRPQDPAFGKPEGPDRLGDS